MKLEYKEAIICLAVKSTTNGDSEILVGIYFIRIPIDGSFQYIFVHGNIYLHMVHTGRKYEIEFCKIYL